MKIEEARIGQDVVLEIRTSITSIYKESGEIGMRFDTGSWFNFICVPAEFVHAAEEPKEVSK